MNDPDPALKQAAVAGDRAAIERLFKELYPPVYGFCYSMTRRQADAEDLAQQTFLRAFKSLRQFRPRQPMAPWILRIAHNLFISQLRTRRPHLELDDPETASVATSEPSPETAAISAETRAELERALRRLAPAARAILVLRYQQQLSYDEIATVIGKPVTTVTNRLFEAKRDLALALRQGGEGGSDALQLVGT